MTTNPDLGLIQKIWPQVHELNDDYTEYLWLLKSMSSKTFNWLRDPRLGADFACASDTLETTLHFIQVFRSMTTQSTTPPQVTTSFSNIQRADIVLQFRNRHSQQFQLFFLPDAAIINSLCLAVSIWATIEVNTHGRSALWGTKTVIDWPDTATLSQIMSLAIPAPSAAGRLAELIDPKLTMEYLCKYHSFQMLWTDDLTEHLTILWGGVGRPHKPIIKVYKHKIFLWNELRFYPTSSILPKKLLEETLDSLNLLFPYGNHATKRFLDKQGHHGQSFYNLAWCSRGRNLDSTRYVYWGEKISRLSDITKGSPVGFSQLLPDRDGRNVMQSINFWTAFWVGAFTIVSVAFGAASIVLAKQALDLTKLQWELSLAQACASAGPDELSEFCG